MTHSPALRRASILAALALLTAACTADGGGEPSPDVASRMDGGADSTLDAGPADIDTRDITVDVEPTEFVDGSDPACDPLRSDGVLCACRAPGFTLEETPGQGWHPFCCDARDDRPWGCTFIDGSSRYWHWFDMSYYGSVCGGRDFPREHALDRCPWEEE